MNFTEIKNKIYFEDGSLRDIYVLDTSIDDWKRWVDTINRKYTVEFYDGKKDVVSDQIDFKTVEDYWKGNRELITATIVLNSVNIKCHFFISTEIENDIDPREFKSEENHLLLVDFLKDISNALRKDVFVTLENTEEIKLITVKNGKVDLNLV